MSIVQRIEISLKSSKERMSSTFFKYDENLTISSIEMINTYMIIFPIHYDHYLDNK